MKSRHTANYSRKTRTVSRHNLDSNHVDNHNSNSNYNSNYINSEKFYNDINNLTQVREPLNIIDDNIYTEDEDEFIDSNYVDISQATGNQNDDDDVDEEVPEILVQHVVSYVEYYDLMKEKKKELAELRQKITPHYDFILNFLNTKSVVSLDVSDGKIHKNITKRIKPLREDLIKQGIINKTGDEKLAQQIIDEIKEIRTRSEEQRVNLKRTFNR